MTGYTTGDVEGLLNLPASTLRFWEKEVPFLAPRKDVFGRRIYSSLDLCVLSRLKHLALERDFGLKAACSLIEKELISGDADLRAEIIELKIGFYAIAGDLSRLRMELDSKGTPKEQESRE